MQKHVKANHKNVCLHLPIIIIVLKGTTIEECHKETLIAKLDLTYKTIIIIINNAVLELARFYLN